MWVFPLCVSCETARRSLWRCPGQQPTTGLRRRTVWLSFSSEAPFSICRNARCRPARGRRWGPDGTDALPGLLCLRSSLSQAAQSGSCQQSGKRPGRSRHRYLGAVSRLAVPSRRCYFHVAEIVPGQSWRSRFNSFASARWELPPQALELSGLRFPPAANAARNCLLLLARDGTAITKKPNAASCPLRAYEAAARDGCRGPGTGCCLIMLETS